MCRVSGWEIALEKCEKTKRQQFLRSNQSKSNFLPKALARSRSLVTYAKLTKSREIKKSYICMYVYRWIRIYIQMCARQAGTERARYAN